MVCEWRVCSVWVACVGMCVQHAAVQAAEADGGCAASPYSKRSPQDSLSLCRCRQRGVRVIGETVASAISQEEGRLWDPDWDVAAQYVMSPPIRSRRELAATAPACVCVCKCEGVCECECVQQAMLSPSL